MKTSRFCSLLLLSGVFGGLGALSAGDAGIIELPWKGKVWDTSGKGYSGTVTDYKDGRICVQLKDGGTAWIATAALNEGSKWELGLPTKPPVQSPAVIAEEQAKKIDEEQRAAKAAAEKRASEARIWLATYNQTLDRELAAREAAKQRANEQRDRENAENLRKIAQELEWRRLLGR